jgi:hypothetical protein
MIKLNEQNLEDNRLKSKNVDLPLDVNVARIVDNMCSNINKMAENKNANKLMAYISNEMSLLALEAEEGEFSELKYLELDVLQIYMYL